MPQTRQSLLNAILQRLLGEFAPYESRARPQVELSRPLTRLAAQLGPGKENLIEYLIVVPVRFHRISGASVALESAFCEHLRLLREHLGPAFEHLTIAAPTMAPAQYARERGQLGQIDEEREGIRWVALQPADAGRLSFWLRHAWNVFASLWREVRRADVVHSGTSHDVWRPFEFTALMLARLLGKKTVCVVDIDLHAEAAMSHRTGRMGRKSLFLCRSVYDPLRRLQLSLAARWCSLVLLKGQRMLREYGHGRAHVKYFLDAAFSAEHLIAPAELERKTRALADRALPLELVYFGRLVAYKGVDRCIQALALASKQSAARVRLSIIGSGEESDALRRLCVQLGVDDRVEFLGAVPFGPQLFARLYPMHLALAAPLSEDTPRSALDALACAIPILAFDTEYYSALVPSGAVDVVPWLSVERLAERIAYYAADKQRLLQPALSALEFARLNTQETWLEARAQWTLDLFEPDVDLSASEGRNGAWQRST